MHGDLCIALTSIGELADSPDCRLLRCDLALFSVLIAPTERRPADVFAVAAQRGHRLTRPLSNTLALEFGNRGDDGEQHIANLVVGDLAAEVQQIKRDGTALEPSDRLQRVARIAEHAIELGGNDRVATLRGREQLGSLWALG
jgi:hypothetical protein